MHAWSLTPHAVRRVAAPLAAATLAAASLTAGLVHDAAPADAAARKRAVATPAVGHVFVVNLENKGYDETFGPDSPAPYLSRR